MALAYFSSQKRASLHYKLPQTGFGRALKVWSSGIFCNKCTIHICWSWVRFSPQDLRVAYSAINPMARGSILASKTAISIFLFVCFVGANDAGAASGGHLTFGRFARFTSVYSPQVTPPFSAVKNFSFLPLRRLANRRHCRPAQPSTVFILRRSRQALADFRRCHACATDDDKRNQA